MPRLTWPSILLVLSLSTACRAGDESDRFFEAKVRPLLVDQCLKCHGPAKQKGGLRLDSRAAVLSGGDSGPALVAGKPEESLIVQAVKQEDDGPKMPPSKKLSPEQVGVLETWVKLGAPWPGEVAGATAAAKKAGFAIKDSDRAHWAFQPVARPAIPPVKDAAWVANPIDSFILAKLEANGLKPNPPASKHALMRRVTYDLTGLPPSPAEVDAFVADDSPEAYGKLVDRLLASPRYGEKWARHWLDLVRFAETNSYERDGVKPSAWRYRDYVIRSLNDDKPYDRFLREQIAGDELPDRSNETITATGYYRLGIWDDEPSDREQALFDGFDDIVATTSQVFLGLTVDCARCHDHKLDPIAQKDYYKLVAFFRNITPYRNGGPSDEYPIVEPGHEDEVATRAKELEARREEIRKSVAGLEAEFRKRTENPENRDLDELKYRFYRDTWSVLPDFDSLKHEDAGELAGGLFDLAPRTRDDSFGFVFEGTLIVPESGRYTFYLDSDDGSRLSLQGKRLAQRDGIHDLDGDQVVDVDLQAGRSPIRLDYFQAAGGFGLKLAWSGPGFAKRSLSAPLRDRKAPKPDIAALMQKDGLRVLGEERFHRYQVLRRQLFELRGTKAIGETALCVTETGRAVPETFVLARGNAHVPAEKVEPGFLTVLGTPDPSIPAPPESAKSSGRRLVLADWLASPGNPLPSRVMANRLVQHHFRPWNCALAEQFRPPGRQADAPGVAGLAGIRTLVAKLASEADAPADRHVECLQDVVGAEPGSVGEGPHEQPLLAVRPQASDGRRNSRFGPLGHRHLEPRDVRAGRLSRGAGGSAGGAVGPGCRLEEVIGRGRGAEEHLRPRQEVATPADPRRLRHGRDRPILAGPVLHHATHPGPGHAQRRVPEQASGLAGRSGETRRRRRPEEPSPAGVETGHRTRSDGE